MNYAKSNTDVFSLISSEPVPKKIVIFAMCPLIAIVFIFIQNDIREICNNSVKKSLNNS